MQKRHAILVGVNNYGEESGFSNLKFAERDAELLGEVLHDHFGYSTTVLTGKKATRENIMNSFMRLGGISNGEKFVFFFAGHGQTIGNEYFLHPQNAKVDNDIYSVRMNRLMDYFENYLPHNEVIGIIDACHKTVHQYQRGVAELDHIATRDVVCRIQQEPITRDKLIKILYSCGYKQASFEDDSLSHGVMTYYLIKKLREKGNHLSFDSIAKEIGEDVPLHVRHRFNSNQAPILFTPLTKRETWFGNNGENSFPLINTYAKKETENSSNSVRPRANFADKIIPKYAQEDPNYSPARGDRALQTTDSAEFVWYDDKPFIDKKAQLEFQGKGKTRNTVSVLENHLLTSGMVHKYVELKESSRLKNKTAIDYGENKQIKDRLIKMYVKEMGGKTVGRKWMEFCRDMKSIFGIKDENELIQLVKEENERSKKLFKNEPEEETPRKDLSFEVLSKEQRIEFLNKLSLKMKLIIGSRFEMGSEEGLDNETPVHVVELDNFYIGKYPVTFDQFDQFCEDAGYAKPSDNGWGRGDRPVININWQSATAFCKWLSDKTGYKFRLPTEAEWEFAASGGKLSKNHKYSGSSNIEDVAWFKKNSQKRTHSIGQKKPNELGLYDMSGNVCEWVSDWYSEYYYLRGLIENPAGPDTGFEKVIRGGSANYNDYAARNTYRQARHPNFADPFCGFRIVMETK